VELVRVTDSEFVAGGYSVFRPVQTFVINKKGSTCVSDGSAEMTRRRCDGTRLRLVTG